MPLSYAQKLGFHSVCSIFEDFNSIRCENLRSVRYFCPQTVNFATNVAGTPNKAVTASELVNIDDVNWLNKLQLLSAAHLVGFFSQTMGKSITSLKSNNKKTVPTFFKILKKAKSLYKTPQVRNPQAYQEFLKFLKSEGAL